MGGGQLRDGRTWRFNFIFPFLYLFFSVKKNHCWLNIQCRRVFRCYVISVRWCDQLTKVQICTQLQNFAIFRVFAKNRKVGDFSKASWKKDIGRISFSGTQYQKQINRLNRLQLQSFIQQIYMNCTKRQTKCMGMKWYFD